MCDGYKYPGTSIRSPWMCKSIHVYDMLAFCAKVRIKLGSSSSAGRMTVSAILEIIISNFIRARGKKKIAKKQTGPLKHDSTSGPVTFPSTAPRGSQRKCAAYASECERMFKFF